MAFFKYGATVNIKKQASLDIIAKDVPEVSHTADKISAKKDDNFVYFWTRAVSADVPNLNSDLFPLDELKKAYPTFIGRGLYMDHNAQSVANAVGKVFDAKLLEDPTATEEEGRYYVGCLCGVDKTTHPDIAAKVAHGVIDSVSMGASCGSCQCNICNRVCHTPEEFCVHLQHQGQIDPETGKKCISINRDVNFSELSLVGVPADPMAKMQQVFAEFVGGLNKSASLEKEAENSFLEKFSFSIPCGNEKICETLFNVLTGYKKQGISDLSMDGSILKLSVEAKNEDLAKQKLEKISEEQGLDVEKPLQKEEKSMPEEIKPVEEQVEKKAGIVPTEYLPKEQNKSDLQEVESSNTQSNEVKDVKAEEKKETKKEDLVPGVSRDDTKKAIEHDLAKEKEEAKGGEDETKDIETLEKAIKETDKGALSKVIDLLKKFIGGEAKEGEDLKDYKSDDLVKKLEEKPADKKASIEEPVNNVVNTVAEPVMDHIEAKPEVPAQPVPEVKEEVEEKKEEVKPSKDVKTKEDAVKVLEDVLKAGEEADVKELGKVLDFLKSDKKEEKKEEVKEVEEKDEPKKEEPVKEEKKSEVEEPLEVEAKKEPTKEPEARCEAEVKEEAKPLFANVTRVSLLKTANLIDSKWVFHFKGTDKVACLSVKNLLPGVSEKVAYLTSKEFYNEMMDTLTKKQAFDGEAVKQIVANYNEKIKVGSDEAKSQVSKATSKAKNETDGKKVSDTSKAVDTKLTDDGKAQKQDKVNSKEDAGAIESATKKAPAETDIKVSAELEAKCKQLTAALEAKEAEVSQMKMQQELAAKTAKARQIVEKSIKCGLVQCNETFRQEELLKQASPLKAKEEAMKRTADSMVADLLALSDEELDKQASYLSNFKVEAEVKQLKPIKIEASCEQSEDEDLIKALGAEMW